MSADETIKTPPAIIYLQWWDEEGHPAEEVTWCQDRINDSDAVYVLQSLGGVSSESRGDDMPYSMAIYQHEHLGEAPLYPVPDVGDLFIVTKIVPDVADVHWGKCVFVELRKVGDQTNEIIGMMEVSLANAEDAIEKLKADNASAERENERLERRVAELTVENERLKKLIADSNAARLWPDIVGTATQ